MDTPTKEAIAKLESITAKTREVLAALEARIAALEEKTKDDAKS